VACFVLLVGGPVHGGKGGSRDVLRIVATGSPDMLPGMGVRPV